jgi:hypothetical protein
MRRGISTVASHPGSDTSRRMADVVDVDINVSIATCMVARDSGVA